MKPIIIFAKTNIKSDLVFTPSKSVPGKEMEIDWFLNIVRY